MYDATVGVLISWSLCMLTGSTLWLIGIDSTSVINVHFLTSTMVCIIPNLFDGINVDVQ